MGRRQGLSGRGNALEHWLRRTILRELHSRAGGHSGTEMANVIEISRSMVGYHLLVLKEGGLVGTVELGGRAGGCRYEARKKSDHELLRLLRATAAGDEQRRLGMKKGLS
jgi:predicted transcriptional regulator